MSTSKCALASFCMVAFAVIGPTQTYVVDASGGGHFLDLPQAVSAVPSGAVLRVRPGSYTAFALANKSLSVIGDDAATVVVNFGSTLVALGPTSTADRILLRNLRLVQATLGGDALLVTSALGEVVLDRVTVDPAGLPLFTGERRVVISNSANVHLSALSMPSHTVPAPTPSGLGRIEVVNSRVEIRDSSVVGVPSSLTNNLPTGPALSTVNSLVFCVNTRFVGGYGASAQGCGLPSLGPTKAGPGAKIGVNSVLHAIGSSITGGVGGAGIACRPAGANGGNGIEATSCRLRFAGTPILGGAGGPTGGLPGVPLTSNGVVTVEQAAHPVVAATLRGTASPGLTVTCSLQAGANDVALLAFGYEQVFVPLDPIVTTGAVLVLPLVLLGPFQVPTTGVLDVPLTLPTSWPVDQWIPFQFFTGPTTLTELWASNSVGICAR